MLFKKALQGPASDAAKGTGGAWDSIHVFEVHVTGRTAQYKVTSTVMLTLKRQAPGELGLVDLSGHLTRQGQDTQGVTDSASHIVNLGRLMEDMESKIRNQLQEIYFGKMRDTVDQLRSTEDLEALRLAQQLQEELRGGWER